MSRASASRPEFGLLAGGAVARSLVGRMQSRAALIGPVAAVSFRVASRIANALRAGHAVRSLQELDTVQAILFYSPPAHAAALLQLLLAAPLRWEGKSLIFCDTEAPPPVLASLRERGAAIAVIHSLGSLNTAVMESNTHAHSLARRVVLDAGLRAVEIPVGAGPRFAVALTLCTAALTPVMERAALLFRLAGLRHAEGARLAARLVSRTAAEYAHSGKQSWPWHVRPPDPERIASEVAAAPAELRPFLRELILAGFTDFGKHPEVADRMRSLINVGVDIPSGK